MPLKKISTIWDYIGLSALALFLRFPALTAYRDIFHPDESVYVFNSLDSLSFNRVSPEYYWVYFGLLLPLFFAGLVFVLIVSGRIDGVHSVWAFYKNEPIFFHLAGRYFVACLGVATVLLLYAFVRRWFNRTAALIAALLLCVSFSHVRNSHFVTPDVPVTLFILAALWGGMLISTQDKKKVGILTGLLTGFSMTVKFSAFPAVLIVPAAYWVRRGWRGLFSPISLVAMGMIPVGFFIASPYSLFFINELLPQFQNFQRAVIEKPGAICQSPFFTYIFKLFPVGLGWVGLVMALLGLVAGLRHWRKYLPLYVFGFAYLFMLCRQTCCYERYALPLMTLLALAAGAFISAIRSRALFMVLSVLTLLPPLIFSLRFDQLIAGPDIRHEALAWLKDSVHPGDKILMMWGAMENGRKDVHLAAEGVEIHVEKGAVDSITLPMPTIGNFEDYRDYQWIVDNSYYRESALDPLVISYYPNFSKKYREFYKNLDLNAQLVRQFSPMKNGHGWRFFFEDVYGPFGQLFERKKRGPVVSIYKIKQSEIRSKVFQ